ncbi:hypothetical protein FOB31_08620 [Burkholderia multivorans]|nr:hypothetical protein FOB31_08620 [Burkholderia multivorans]QET39555.1 hypothetical protein FOB30_17755 [Burkholderia multivorans]
MPGAAAQVGHVLIDIHRVTREASRVARHEFVGLAWRGVAPGAAAGRLRQLRSIVSGLRCVR